MEDPCPICYEKVDVSSGHCTLPCNHTFHFHCMHTWADKNTSCPLCRKDITPAMPQGADDLQAFEGVRFHYVPQLERLVNLGEVVVGEDDILFIMDQCSTTRSVACQALKICDGDVVDSVYYIKEVLPEEDRDTYGPQDFSEPTAEQKAYWNLHSLFESTTRDPNQSKRVVRWRSARGSNGGECHESAHWRHLEGLRILDKDGYDTD